MAFVISTTLMVNPVVLSEVNNNQRFVFMMKYEADFQGDPGPESPRRKPRSKQARALELIEKGVRLALLSF